jgi:leucine dehydrogenase
MKAPAKSSASSSRVASTRTPSSASPAAASPRRSENEGGGEGGIFSLLAEHEHEQVSCWYEPSSGYRGLIAIHNTTLGPALGGTRFWNYTSDREALIDALRLSRGMTYKAAVAGLNLGGGKSVILGDNKTTWREAIFRAHGRHIESLGGRYITAEDVGTGPADMELIRAETEHVTGLMGKSGDPSPVTAYGVYRGIKACAKHRYGSDSLSGKTVTVQGCGHVGYFLCKLLFQEGATLIVTDLDPLRVKAVVQDFRATAVAPDHIYGQQADIFAPCALGAVINDDTLKALRVDIIAGGANNQLAEDRHGVLVEEQGMVYAPDYVINGGGLINVNAELHGWSLERARNKAGEIYDTILRVFEIAKQEKIPSYQAADRLAQHRIAAIAKVRQNFV